MLEVAHWSIEGNVGVLTVNYPPVNALGSRVRRALQEGFQCLTADSQVLAIVLICDGRTFFAGADITELGKPLAEPDLSTVYRLIEAGPRPVVAAIHGSAFGGGLELAMVCHYRIAVPSAKFGLPEVTLGLLPGAGGTQRLPRIVGPEIALDMIAFGKPIDAARALQLGLLDRMASENDLRLEATAFAQRIIKDNRQSVRTRDRTDKIDAFRGNPAIFRRFRSANANAFRGLRAPDSIIRCVEAATELPFNDGVQLEATLFQELNMSAESAAQRYAFFSERESAKVPDVTPGTPAVPIRSVGVIGAGVMGECIAMTFLDAGIPVTLIDSDAAALELASIDVHTVYAGLMAKAPSAAAIRARMSLLSTATELETLQVSDLIIEAVDEDESLKKHIFTQLDVIAKTEAILASNTSSLNLDEIAACTQRPHQVLGLNFIAPSCAVRLLEVVRTRTTSSTVLATVLKLAKQLGKVPVVSGIGHGSIANRLRNAGTAAAEMMCQMGFDPRVIDAVIFNFGFPMGSFRQRITPSETIVPNPSLALPTEEIIVRVLYPIVNEAAKILEDGIAIRASDIDVTAMLGIGWPAYSGGPMYWGSRIGLMSIFTQLSELERRHGEAFRPAQLLERLAREHNGFV